MYLLFVDYLISRATETQTQISAANPKMNEPDVFGTPWHVITMDFRPQAENTTIADIAVFNCKYTIYQSLY
jgi:hypothetical protein